MISQIISSGAYRIDDAVESKSRRSHSGSIEGVKIKTNRSLKKDEEVNAPSKVTNKRSKNHKSHTYKIAGKSVEKTSTAKQKPKKTKKRSDSGSRSKSN